MNHNICPNSVTEDFLKFLFLFQLQNFAKTLQPYSPPVTIPTPCKPPCKALGTRELPWGSEEDSIILNQVKQNGAKHWSKIAHKINFQVFNSKTVRKGKHCRERFFNHLDPSLNKGDWTETEDLELFRLQAKYGNAWSFIAKSLPGRNENSVRNRWNSLNKKIKVEKTDIL